MSNKVLIVKFNDDGEVPMPRELSPMVQFIASEMEANKSSGELLGGTSWALLDDEGD